MAGVEGIIKSFALLAWEEEEASMEEAKAVAAPFDKEHEALLKNGCEIAAANGATVTVTAVGRSTGERHVTKIYRGDDNCFAGGGSLRRRLRRRTRLGSGTVEMLGEELRRMRLPEARKLVAKLNAVRLSALRRLKAREQAGARP